MPQRFPTINLKMSYLFRPCNTKIREYVRGNFASGNFSGGDNFWREVYLPGGNILGAIHRGHFSGWWSSRGKFVGGNYPGTIFQGKIFLVPFPRKSTYFKVTKAIFNLQIRQQTAIFMITFFIYNLVLIAAFAQKTLHR